jgi:hypothetical protein
MRPVPVEQPRFDQPRSIMMLDDAEMALQMNELAELAPAALPKRPAAAQKSPAAPAMQLNDFLTELYAAASLIMDREECDALVQEMLAKHELIAA